MGCRLFIRIHKVMLQASPDDQQGPPPALTLSDSAQILKPQHLQKPHFLLKHLLSQECAVMPSEMLTSSNSLLYLTVHFESDLGLPGRAVSKYRLKMQRARVKSRARSENAVFVQTAFRHRAA